MLANDLIAFLDNYVPSYREAKFLLAVSGGMDSMILLDLFKTQDLQIAVAHCNFNLRGEESRKDEELVIERCKELGIKYYYKEFDTKKEKDILKEGTQIVARKLRFAWFEELRNENGFDYICTAHHQRDNTETMIYRFMRGAFPESMQGIKPVNGRILHPMLFMNYEGLMEYQVSHKIDYRIDQSNEELNYTRNKIRKILLPELKSIFGSSLENDLGNTSSRYYSYYAFIRQSAENLIKQKHKWKEIEIGTLKHTEGNTALLYECIKSYGFNWGQAEDICSNLDREQGSVFENDDRSNKLYFAGNALQLLPSKKKNQMTELQLNADIPNRILFDDQIFEFEILKKEGDLQFKPNHSYLDYDLLKDKPLCMRYWEEGDSFRPMGMTGTKSVADFLKDQKLSPAEKYFQSVLCSEAEVIGIPGGRVDNKYRITEKTRKLLVISPISPSSSGADSA
jgi:tRNA(Ile)-lysidine synthase